MEREKLFGVTGNPVLHSKSPVIFNTLFDELKVNAVYTRIAANSAEEAMFLFHELGLKGMNVTAPFKKDIMEYLDDIAPAAEQIGGVNTVVRENGYIKGYNTDHLGVTDSLINRGITIENKRCTVLGAGGAGRSAIFGLMRDKANVTLVNRTFDKAVEIGRTFGCEVEKLENLETVLMNSDILVSALSSSIDIIPSNWLHRGLVVFDANYKHSPLSEKAEQNGCMVIKGDEWLINQAIPAYRHFLGTSPEDSKIKVLLGSGAVFQKSPWLPEAKNIALIGFMGSGKSFIGRLLADRLGYSFKDLDEETEKKASRSIPDIFRGEGEASFRVIEKTLLKEELPNHSGVVYACGGGVVVDEENRNVLKENALVIWLYSTIETSLKRIPKGTRPLLDCESPMETARNILASRLGAYARTANLVVNSEPDADKVVEKIHGEIDKTFGS
jgi:shikimate dehydrogenase